MKPRRSRPRCNPSYTGNTALAAACQFYSPVQHYSYRVGGRWAPFSGLLRCMTMAEVMVGWWASRWFVLPVMPVPVSHHLAVNFSIRNCVELCNPTRCNSKVTRINTDSLVKRGTFSLKFKIYPRQYRNIKTLAIRLDTAQARTI